MAKPVCNFVLKDILQDKLKLIKFIKIIQHILKEETFLKKEKTVNIDKKLLLNNEVKCKLKCIMTHNNWTIFESFRLT